MPLGTKLVFPLNDLGFTRMRGQVVIDDRSRPSDVGGAVRFFVGSQGSRTRSVLSRLKVNRPYHSPRRSQASTKLSTGSICICCAASRMRKNWQRHGNSSVKIPPSRNSSRQVYRI